MEISRREFVRDAARTLAFTSLVGEISNAEVMRGEDPYYATVVKANDAAVPAVLERVHAARPLDPRVLSTAVDTLTGSYCAPESAYFQAASLLPALELASDKLLAAQHADGTIDSGNYNSPPDTGFVVQQLCTALVVLRRMNHPQLSPVNSKLEKFLLAAGDALTTGGIHTPNHRWVISSALAQLNGLFPSPKYVERVDDWLGEGIYCDADGQFSERSTGIYSRVIDNALITMARSLSRPALLEPVRRNLAMNIFYMHPGGELETVGSRRQDQIASGSIANYYMQYRYLAILDQNRQFAAAARLIEQMGFEHAELKFPLVQFLEEPLYRRTLPEAEPLPTVYTRVFHNSSLARIRRGEVSATIFGGTDWPLGVASGLSSSPTFFNFRKGKAVLESVRMTPDFFNEGPFRSKGLEVQDNTYMLRQQLTVPYYQPLPRQFRNASGDYPLTQAGHRFWSKLDFSDRPKSNIQTLDQRVRVSENRGSFELAFDVQGHDRVPVVIELTFRKGGELRGTEPSLTAPNVHFLRQGIGQYVVGTDVIRFGPGAAALENLPTPDLYHDPYVGVSNPDTYRVYITGFTPFLKTVTVA